MVSRRLTVVRRFTPVCAASKISPFRYAPLRNFRCIYKFISDLGDFSTAHILTIPVLPGTKVDSGKVFRRDGVKAEDLFLKPQRQKENPANAAQKPHGPLPIDGMEYKFEDGV